MRVKCVEQVKVPLTAIVAQHEHPDGRGQSHLNPACGVYFRGECVDRLTALSRDVPKSLPELIFQRHAGAVATQTE